MITATRGALRSGEPSDLLINISTLLEVTDPRRHRPHSDEAGPQRETLIESFLELSYAETTAALMVINAFLPDEVLRARIVRELRTRRQPTPDWLRDLEGTRVVSDVSGPVGEKVDEDFTENSRWLEPRKVLDLAESLGLRGHTVFGGRIPTDPHGLVEKSMAKNTPEELRDARNWDVIRRWADGVAAELTSVAT